MNKYIRNFLLPLIWIRRQYDNYLKANNPEKLFSIYYKRSTGKYLNIDNPNSLTEKIAYLSFRTDTSEWSKLADKVKVRTYVTACGYGQHLPQIFGIWNKVSEINFESLPKSFVLKTNNASATNILVKDKQQANISEIIKLLTKWMKIDYGYISCQPHYSRIFPLILAEEYLTEDGTYNSNKMIKDFKFYCVHGSPLYVFVYTDRQANSHDMKRSIYDMNWKRYTEFIGSQAVAGPDIDKPQSLDLMIQIARKLSEPFPFVRIDFYEINNKPIFGEMTFTPGMQEASLEFDEMLGKMIKI